MPSINNVQNINRVYTKMSEGFHDGKNSKLSGRVKSINYFQTNSSPEDLSDEDIDVIDYLYPSNENEGNDNELNSPVINCQTTESEVKFIKEWLILQTDLIQQQNDDIIDKDREIFALRQENEMLKEHIKRIEKGVSFQTNKESNHKVTEDSAFIVEAVEDMTQGPSDEDTKENIDVVEERYYDSEDCLTELTNFRENNLNVSDNESQIDSAVLENDNNFSADTSSELELKSEEVIISDISECYKTEPDLLTCDSSLSEYFSVNDICDTSTEPMKNLRMSIRRKRVCSNSSAMSPNESLLVEEKECYQHFKKKKRRLTKDIHIITSLEPYITQAHEVNVGIATSDLEISNNLTTLEVPRWRHKIYASCYTMEGTENLDDDVYNKRHMRLEIDERRRKRWDVQRIREQRVIEKLKQRQEKTASGSKGEDNEHTSSLWPKKEDVKYLEISDELPVSAFGSPVPKVNSSMEPLQYHCVNNLRSEFNLPWYGSPSVLTVKRQVARRSTGKRKSLKR